MASSTCLRSVDDRAHYPNQVRKLGQIVIRVKAIPDSDCI